MIKAARGLKKTGPRGQDAGGNGSPRPRRVTIAVTSLAPPAGEVKWTPEPSLRDTRDGHPRRPSVLRHMPTSCSVVFDVLRAMATGEAVELSIRELAEMCRLSYAQTRRALRRLQGAHLIRWQNHGPGRGHRSVFEVRWASPSFPQLNDSSPLNKFLSEKEGFSFCEQKTHPASLTPHPPQLEPRDWEPSERAIRWALARARERLWGLPKPRRERAMDALAVAFRWGARQPGPWSRERWRRFVMSTLGRFEGGPEGFTLARRRPYAWAMRCVQEALQELRQRDAELQATEAILTRIKRGREAAKLAWLTPPASSRESPLCAGMRTVRPDAG